MVQVFDKPECDKILPERKYCSPIKKILIVEDSLSLLEHIQTSLCEALDIECDIAATEKEAAALLKVGSYDLVIMDIYLPDSSGNFIGALIRKKNRILILTGSDDEVQREKLVSLPIVDYLYKTDEKTIVSYLIRAIKRLMKNEQTIVGVCDDSKVSRLQIMSILANQNLAYVELFDGKDAYEYIVEQGMKVDLIITDVNMPRMNGIDLVRHIRHSFSANELPVLALSASEKPSIVAQLLKIGANDYVNKPISNEEFLTRLNATLDQSRLYHENQIMIKQLQMAATTDFLTKLYNRNFFYSSIKHVQAQARREGYKYGIIMIDIDHFKQINDNYGHDAGDMALKMVAEIISEAARESDIACRWGGEEFLILVPKSNLTALVEFSERLRKLIEDSPIVIDPLFLEFSITASFGVTIGRDEDIEVVIARADEYLYKVKESGRNAIGFK